MKMNNPSHFKATLTAAAVFVFALSCLTQPASAAVTSEEIQVAAPQEYTVRKGDTLWGISGRFLKSPWNWRQLWASNKGVVENPDLIYPGEVLVLYQANGRYYLQRQGSRDSGEIRLKPGVRIEEATASSDAIPSFSFAAVDKFLAKPALIEQDQFSKAPRVIAEESGKIFAGAGSKVFSRGLTGKAGSEFSVFRQGAPLVDPDTKETLANEAISLGSARLIQSGETSILEVLNSTQEITLGDRLIPVERASRFDTPIQSAPVNFAGKIIKVYDPRSSSLLADNGIKSRTFEIEGGPMSVVVLNKGARDQLQEGHVLAVSTRGKTIGRSSTLGFRNGERVDDPFKLPDQVTGQAIVFKVFEKVAYALIVKAEKPIESGDGVQAP